MLCVHVSSTCVFTAVHDLKSVSLTRVLVTQTENDERTEAILGALALG